MLVIQADVVTGSVQSAKCQKLSQKRRVVGDFVASRSHRNANDDVYDPQLDDRISANRIVSFLLNAVTWFVF